MRLQAFEAQLVSSPANCDVEEVQELVTTHLVPWLNTTLTPRYIVEAKNDPSEWWRIAADAISPETARMPLVDRIAAVRVLLPMTIALPTDDDDAALPAYHALRAVALEALTRALRLCVALGAMDFAVALVQLARVDYSDRREKAFESIRKNAEKRAAKKEKKEKSDKKGKKAKRAGANEEQSDADSSAAQSSSGIFGVTDVSEVTPQMVVDYTRKNYNIIRSPAYVTLLLWFSSVTRIDEFGDFDIAPFMNLDRGAVPAVAISYAASDAERQWSHALCVFFTTPGFLAADAPALPPSIAPATTANPVVSDGPRADATFTAKTHAIGTDRYHDKFCERLFTRVRNDAREAKIAPPGPHHDDERHGTLSVGLLLAHALAADVNTFAEREFSLNPPNNNASATGDYNTVVGLIASSPAFGLWLQHYLTPFFPSSLVFLGVMSELLTVILSLLLDSPKNGAEVTSLSARQRRALQLLRRCLDPVIARLPTTPLPPAEMITARLHITAGARGAFTPLLLPLLKQPSDAEALAALTRCHGDSVANARVNTLDLDDTAFVLWLDIAHPEPGDMSLTARLQIARRENVLEWLSPQRGQVWMPYVRTSTAPKQLLPFGDEPMTAFALMPAAPLPRENNADEDRILALPVLSPTQVSPRVLVDYLLSLIDNPTGDPDLDAVAAAVPALILQQASVRGAMHDNMARDAGRWRNNATDPEFLPSLSHAALQDRLRGDCDMSFDIAIAIDTTGSMSPYIDGLRRHVTTVVNNLAQEIKQRSGRNAVIRLGIAPYNDHKPGCTRTTCDTDRYGTCHADYYQPYDFVEDMNNASTFMHSLKVVNGDDCEDVLGGLWKATNLTWRANKGRFVLLIGDMPCHGVQYNQRQGYPSTYDSIPGGDPKGITPEMIVNKLDDEARAAGAELHIIAVDPHSTGNDERTFMEPMLMYFSDLLEAKGRKPVKRVPQGRGVDVAEFMRNALHSILSLVTEDVL